MTTPLSLADIVRMMGSTTTVARQEGAEALKRYATRWRSDTHHEDEPFVIKAIDSCLALAKTIQTQLRISGLEALLLLCQEMSPMVARHTARMYAIIDCLTDKKQEVRDGVLAVFLQLAIITTPKTVTERLQPAFAHKAWTINQQALVITKELLKVYKAQLIDSVLINHVFKLLSAAKPDVREEATSTLACMYELLDHNNRPKFRSGIERRRQPGHSLDTVWAALNNVDKCSAPPPETFPTPPSNSQPVATRPMAAVPTPKREPSKNKTTKSKYTLIDEHEFSDFSSCEPLRWAVTSDMLEGTITRLEKFSVEDWDKRRDELRTMRTYLNSDVTALPDYMSQAKRIIPFIGDNMALDLRSQVSKEACVTLCHLAQTMGPHFKVFVPEVISVLMRLLHRNQFFIQCSDCTMKRILTACANPALISKVFVPIIRDKFDLIRSKTAELMELILSTWETADLNQTNHVDHIIKTCLTDASGECRLFGRSAFVAYEKVFPTQAQSLFVGLKPSKFKEMLQRERIKHGLGLEDANTCISRKDISRTDMTTRTQTSVHSPYAARGVQAQAQAHTQAHTSTHAQPAMMAANEATPVRMKSSVSTRPASAMRIGRPGQAPTNRSTGAVAGTAGKGSRSSAALFGARSNGHSAFTNKASHPMRSTTAAQLKNTAQSHTAGSMARARSAYSHSAISKVRPGNHGNGSSRANEPAGEVYSDKPQTITSEHLGRTASLKTKGRTVTKQLSHQLSLPVRGRQTNVPPRIQEHRINTGNVDKARGNREHIMQGIIDKMKDNDDKEERKIILESLLDVLRQHHQAMSTTHSHNQATHHPSDLAQPVLELLVEWSRDKRTKLSQDVFQVLGDFCQQELGHVPRDVQITVLVAVFNRLGVETFDVVKTYVKAAVKQMCAALSQNALLGVCLALLGNEHLSQAGRPLVLDLVAMSVLPTMDKSFSLCAREPMIDGLEYLAEAIRQPAQANAENEVITLHMKNIIIGIAAKQQSFVDVVKDMNYSAQQVVRQVVPFPLSDGDDLAAEPSASLRSASSPTATANSQDNANTIQQATQGADLMDIGANEPKITLTGENRTLARDTPGGPVGFVRYHSSSSTSSAVAAGTHSELAGQVHELRDAQVHAQVQAQAYGPVQTLEGCIRADMGEGVGSPESGAPMGGMDSKDTLDHAHAYSNQQYEHAHNNQQYEHAHNIQEYEHAHNNQEYVHAHNNQEYAHAQVDGKGSEMDGVHVGAAGQVNDGSREGLSYHGEADSGYIPAMSHAHLQGPGDGSAAMDTSVTSHMDVDIENDSERADSTRPVASDTGGGGEESVPYEEVATTAATHTDLHTTPTLAQGVTHSDADTEADVYAQPKSDARPYASDDNTQIHPHTQPHIHTHLHAPTQPNTPVRETLQTRAQSAEALLQSTEHARRLESTVNEWRTPQKERKGERTYTPAPPYTGTRVQSHPQEHPQRDTHTPTHAHARTSTVPHTVTHTPAREEGQIRGDAGTHMHTSGKALVSTNADNYTDTDTSPCSNINTHVNANADTSTNVRTTRIQSDDVAMSMTPEKGMRTDTVRSVEQASTHVSGSIRRAESFSWRDTSSAKKMGGDAGVGNRNHGNGAGGDVVMETDTHTQAATVTTRHAPSTATGQSLRLNLSLSPRRLDGLLEDEVSTKSCEQVQSEPKDNNGFESNTSVSSPSILAPGAVKLGHRTEPAPGLSTWRSTASVYNNSPAATPKPPSTKTATSTGKGKGVSATVPTRTLSVSQLSALPHTQTATPEQLDEPAQPPTPVRTYTPTHGKGLSPSCDQNTGLVREESVVLVREGNGAGAGRDSVGATTVEEKERDTRASPADPESKAGVEIGNHGNGGEEEDGNRSPLSSRESLSSLNRSGIFTNTSAVYACTTAYPQNTVHSPARGVESTQCFSHLAQWFMAVNKDTDNLQGDTCPVPTNKSITEHISEITSTEQMNIRGSARECVNPNTDALAKDVRIAGQIPAHTRASTDTPAQNDTQTQLRQFSSAHYERSLSLKDDDQVSVDDLAEAISSAHVTPRKTPARKGVGATHTPVRTPMPALHHSAMKAMPPPGTIQIISASSCVDLD